MKKVERYESDEESDEATLLKSFGKKITWFVDQEEETVKPNNCQSSSLM
jgi:hypothetical protein